MRLFTEKIEKIALWIVILDFVLIPIMLWWSYYDWARKTPYDQEVMRRLEEIEKSLTVYSESDSMIGYMVSEANRLGVDPDLANRIIWCESRWDPNARNNGGKGGQGLFQVTPQTWGYVTEKMGLPSFSNPYNYKLNIKVGMWLLANEGTKHWTRWSGWCWKK